MYTVTEKGKGVNRDRKMNVKIKWKGVHRDRKMKVKIKGKVDRKMQSGQ